MRKRILRLSLTLIIIISLLMSMTAYAVGDVVYTNTRLLADNLEFINTISWHYSLGRTESFALRMVGQGNVRPIVMKGEAIFGTTRISTMISQAEGRGKNVLAAVNADFFFPQHGGVPMGIVIENGVYKSSPGGRNAVVFGNDGSVDIIMSPVVNISLFNNGGATVADNYGERVNLMHFNKPRTEHGGMMLYSEVFSSVSTRTTTPGWFVRFRILEGTPSVSGTMTLEVTELLTSEDIEETAVAIGVGNLILSAADANELSHEFEKFAVGDIVTLTTSVNDQRLANAEFATGGGYILVSDGAKTDQSGWNPALRNRAPRTAFGIRADGSIIAYVIDGRNAQHSVGMTLDELADEMLRQGAIYAVNFDGGGSSVMSVRIPGEESATLASRPSDGSERGVSTYLLFVTDAVPGGPVANLSLQNDGVIVLAESSVDLSFTATDRGYMPTNIPGDIAATPLEYDSSVSGTIFTAGSIAGPRRLNLYSPSTGATGVGEIFVLNRPTSISAMRRGTTTAISSIRVSPGEIFEFDVRSTFYRRAVISQVNSYEFTVMGDIGEMIAPGVFKAGETMARLGTITISAGGRSIDVAVEIAGFSDMENHWGREYAEYLASVGITTGVTPTEFGPERYMLRGDFILMLHRAAGLPEPSGPSEFEDVADDAYFAQAIAWAGDVGIVGRGVSFDPLAPVSRQSAFTFLYRALNILNIPFESGSAEDLAEFPDAGTVGDFAVVPTATLIRLGIVEGSNGLLIPESTLTRAQMAKVLAMVLQMGNGM